MDRGCRAGAEMTHAVNMADVEPCGSFPSQSRLRAAERAGRVEPQDVLDERALTDVERPCRAVVVVEARLLHVEPAEQPDVELRRGGGAARVPLVPCRAGRGIAQSRARGRSARRGVRSSSVSRAGPPPAPRRARVRAAQRRAGCTSNSVISVLIPGITTLSTRIVEKARAVQARGVSRCRSSAAGAAARRSLSSISFRLPHFGLWTHEGQPFVHGQPASRRAVSATQPAKLSNPRSVIPTPPAWPS